MFDQCCVPKAKQLEKEIYEPVSMQSLQPQQQQQQQQPQQDQPELEPRQPRKSMQFQRQEHQEQSQKEIPKEQEKSPFMPLPIPIIIDPNFEERAVKILESKNTPPEEIEKLKENLVGFRDAIEKMNTGELSYSEMRSRYG